MIRPTLREAQDLAASGDYRMIPVSRELYADGHTPIGVLRRLKAGSSHCYMLESAERDKRWGRYTFLGYAPILELTCQDGRIRVRRGGETTEETGAPGDGGFLPLTKAPACRSCRPSPAAWWAISPMSTSGMPSRP